MGQKLNETLRYLGNKYSIKNIDLEDVIYRKISDFEFEISGLNSKGKYNAIIYVWNNQTIITTVQDISSKESLVEHLEILFQEFQLPVD